MAALVPICVLFAAALVRAAEPPLNGIGESSQPVALNIPAGKGMRYAGPIVYSNEKPPIIYFPPPPKDAKPGFGGLGKKSKAIKYVPMPHHDLPVLIYTSDKTPPIHVVHPTSVEGSPSASQHFGALNPPKGSLSATYKGILPEQTAPRIVSSSYEIPGTSYGRPMSPMESFDSPLSSNTQLNNHQVHPKPLTSYSFGPPAPQFSHAPPRPAFRGPPPPQRKAPPHILYSGHPPIHMYDEPDMFVQAPREIPLKSYEELPPKAAFGPPKPAFGIQSMNSFNPSVSHSPRPSFQSFGSPAPYRTISTYIPPRDNLIPSASAQNPSIISPPNSLNIPKSESTSNPNHAAPAAYPQYGGGQPLGPRPPTYSFSPPQKVFSFGPLSIEYGPPTDEPFVSFSEPQGSLQSFYGALNDGSPAPAEDGWMPGPPPTPNNLPGQLKESVEYNGPPHPPPPPAHHGPPPPGIHNPIYRPHSQPHGQPPHPPPHHQGSKLANLLSSFKLKRSKPKYALAPKSMHKPPIIIYYGKKPPVHVYQKPDEEEHVVSTSSSTSPIAVSSSGESSLSGGDIIINDNRHSSNLIIPATPVDHVDLTYGASQKTEIRVAAPSPSLSIPEPQQTSPLPQESINRPAIIPARPVDIFSQTELEPSIYMARNSLNTIFVSDLNGSGSRAIKTYIVRDEPSPSKLDVPQGAEEEGNFGSIISTIAQDRISGEPDLISSPEAGAPENIQVEQEQEEGNNDDDTLEASSANNIPPTILVVSPQQKEEIIEQQQKQQQQQQQQEDEQVVEETQNVQVQVIQSPSSFQTSLSNAEKEAEEKSTSGAS